VDAVPASLINAIAVGRGLLGTAEDGRQRGAVLPYAPGDGATCTVCVIEGVVPAIRVYVRR